LAYLGDLVAAGEEIREARSAGWSGPYLAAAEALVAAMSGRMELAKSLILQHERARPDSYHAPLVLAESAAVLGDVETAVRILRAFEQIQMCHQKYWLYRIAPGLSRVREAPEFQEWLGERGRHIVWPLEAPPLADSERAQFLSFSEGSGVPVGDEVP
jgi:hypothetical protein